MSKTWCVLADIGLSVQNPGETSVCNQSQARLKHTDGNTITLDRYTIEDAWNSPTRQEIRTALANGEQHSNCSQCWQEEAAGRTSFRIINNQQFKKAEPLLDQPRAVFLKPGNVCNLSCRHCGPTISSRWYSDYYQVNIKPEGVAYNDWLKKFAVIRDSYNDDNQFWRTLESWIPGMLYYDLYGAEPLLIDPLYQIILSAANNGASSAQDIHINTNGTIWHDDYYSAFSKFRSVQLEISADGVADRFEYMRYPAKWDSVLNNLQNYKKLADANHNIHVGISVTLSLYNIWDAKEIKRYFVNELGINNVGFNILHYPPYMDMRNAPKSAKEQISQHLESTDQQLNAIIDFLNGDITNQESNLKQFFYYTKEYDQLRNQDYSKTFPEMYNLMKDYQ
jgi:hypothetical protein